MTIANYFLECEHNKADLHSSTNDAFHEDWMSTSGLTYLWTMTFEHVVFPVLTSYVMIKWVRGSSREDENENER